VGQHVDGGGSELFGDEYDRSHVSSSGDGSGTGTPSRSAKSVVSPPMVCVDRRAGPSNAT
jgi:hypothetical protein